MGSLSPLSDGEDGFGKGRLKPMFRVDIQTEFVVAAV